jgi:hypothetical protein
LTLVPLYDDPDGIGCIIVPGRRNYRRRQSSMYSKRVDADEARLQHNIVSDYSKCKGGICIWIVDVLHLGRAIEDWPSLCGHFQMISRTLFDAL